VGRNLCLVQQHDCRGSNDGARSNRIENSERISRVAREVEKTGQRYERFRRKGSFPTGHCQLSREHNRRAGQRPHNPAL